MLLFILKDLKQAFSYITIKWHLANNTGQNAIFATKNRF